MTAVKYKLSRSKEEEFCLLDSDVAAILNDRSIRLRPDGYATIRYRIGNGKRREMYIHTFVMELDREGCTIGMTVDHLNGDKLDNRRDNLEVVDAKENCRRMNIRKWRKIVPVE